jgi:hypothetical protein
MSLDILVDQDKLAAFADKVYEMARKEFGTCDEGKINKVSVMLVDRSRCWPMHYFPVPYDHKAKTAEEKERILDHLLTNAKIATDELHTHMKIMQDERRMAAKKAEGKKK